MYNNKRKIRKNFDVKNTSKNTSNFYVWLIIVIICISIIGFLLYKNIGKHKKIETSSFGYKFY